MSDNENAVAIVVALLPEQTEYLMSLLAQQSGEIAATIKDQLEQCICEAWEYE